MYWNTITPTLRKVLGAVMETALFDPFRLVGGTSLSLQLGHRVSVDIDLFTDAGYGVINFNLIDEFFLGNFPYVDTHKGIPVAMGKSWYVGANIEDAIKVDIYYTDAYIRPEQVKEGIRMAAREDIIAMKLEVIGSRGRKKDFWDIHRLHDEFTIKQMIELYLERYPYNHSEEEIRMALTNAVEVENDFAPQCLLGKSWELIKLEITQWVANE